jgi:hypothetical protein
MEGESLGCSEAAMPARTAGDIPVFLARVLTKRV